MLLAPRGLGNAGGGAWRRRSPRLLDDVRRRNRLRRRSRWAGSTRASAPVRRRALKEPRALASSDASGRPCAQTSSWSIFSLTPSSFSASCGPERPSSSFWWTVSSLLSSSPCWTSRSLSGSKLVLSPRRARHLTRYDTPHPSLGQALTEPYSAGAVAGCIAGFVASGRCSRSPGGQGPPVAQSINSIVWTAGSSVPAAI